MITATKIQNRRY